MTTLADFDAPTAARPNSGVAIGGPLRGLQRRRQTRRGTLHCRGRGYCRLPSSQNVPGCRYARHLARAPTRTTHPRLAAPRRAGSDPCLAQIGPRGPSRSDGALTAAVPSHLPRRSKRCLGWPPLGGLDAEQTQSKSRVRGVSPTPLKDQCGASLGPD